MSETDHDDPVRMELGAESWHENDSGEYYIDCPECGSAATLSNLFTHGRCNAYLDQGESETEVDESAMDCTARLSLELVYDSDPTETMTDEAVDRGDSSE